MAARGSEAAKVGRPCEYKRRRAWAGRGRRHHSQAQRPDDRQPRAVLVPFSHLCGNSGRQRSINTRGPPEPEIPSADGSMLSRALPSSLLPAPLFRPGKLFLSATLRRSYLPPSSPRLPSSRNMSGFTQVCRHRLSRRLLLITAGVASRNHTSELVTALATLSVI